MTETRREQWLVRVGVACFLLGLTASLAVFVPFLSGFRNGLTAVALSTMLAPLGFALATVDLFRSSARPG
jgi:hypothetical protein